MDSAASGLVMFFEAERQRLTEMAAASGMPTSIRVPVRTLQWNADGYRTETREEQRSALTDPLAELRFGGIGSLHLGDRFREAVRALLDTHGLTLVEPNLGPGILKNRVDDDYIAHLANDNGELAAAVHVFLARNEYLAALSDLAQPDDDLAGKIAQELIAYEASTTFTDVTAIPLAGVDVDQPVVAGPLTLRALTGTEAERLHAEHSDAGRGSTPIRRPFSTGLGALERYVLEARASVPKDAPEIRDLTALRVILAMIILDVGVAGTHSVAFTWREPRWLSAFTRHQPTLLPPRERTPPTSITDADLDKIRVFAEKIPDGAVAEPATAVDHSIRRFQIGCSRSDDSDAIIDLVVALEGILLPDIGVEQRWRFGIHGAHFLTREVADRREVRQLCRKLYDARSALVHGGKIPSATELRTLRPEAERLARAGMQRAILDGWPHLGWYDKVLLDTNA